MQGADLTTNIIILIVGIAVLLLGMNLMSTGLKKVSGPRVRSLFNKIKNNRFLGLGIGAGATALIQSSAATSVMAVGFINAGVMSIFQAVSIIMGAYIGTTATGLIVSLSTLNGGGSSFSIDLVFMCLIVIGVVLSFFKKNIVKHIGEICSGLGLLFLGLFMLNGAFKYPEIQNAFTNLFSVVSNPFLLLLIGMLLTMLVQSSSASTGIMIVMVAAGAVNVSAAIYVAVGATIGTVVTTILATIGGSTNAKRTAAIVFTMRVLMALLFLAIFWPINSAFNIFDTMSKWFGPNTGLFIAVFMVIYNVITMFMLLPFIRTFENLATKLIKDKQAEGMKSYIKFIDDKLINSPAIAMSQVKKEIVNMNQLTKDNFIRAYDAIINQNFENEDLICKTEEGIDYLNITITDFLINLSHNADDNDLRIIGGYFHALNDIERIGDHAYNFLENAKKMKDLDLKFSETAKKELEEMYDAIVSMFDQTFKIFEKATDKKVEELHNLEDKTDVLATNLAKAHYERITKNQCKPELSPFYSTFVSELERVADHLTNIGYISIHPTGDVE